MIALLLALTVGNMPPPPPDICKKRDAGTPCLTPRRREGTCATTQCPQTEVTDKGAKTVMVECRVCQQPDGGIQ